MKLYYVYILPLIFLLIASCNPSGKPEDIQGVWMLDDYLLEEGSKEDEAVLAEAKATLKGNDNNFLFFSATHTGAVMSNGDTLTNMAYAIMDSVLTIEGAGASNFRMKDKNTLHIYEAGAGLIVQFKRK